jgi:hypothetical protein
MAELERELITLGRALEFPPTPNLAARIGPRLDRAPEPRAWPWRRIAVVAIAAALLAIAVAFAVPPARTAILRWFGLSGVRIRQVGSLPPTRTEGPLLLGRRVSLAEARAKIRYHVLVPKRAPHPDAVFLSTYPPGGMVSFAYGDRRKPRLLMMQFEGTTGPYIEKLVVMGTHVERVKINGRRGFFLSGAPHELHFLGPNYEDEIVNRRLAGNTLLWERGSLTLRLEGRMTKDEAVAIARSVR